MLRHRRRAIALAVTHGYPVGAGGSEVDVVGAGGGDQDQLEVRAGGHGGGVDQDLVTDGDRGALEVFDDLIGQGLGEQLQFAETTAQRVEVKVAEVQGRVVEEYGAASVRHQLYLLCNELKA
ncbi:hypothetical protein D3C80_795630 [compost metagenome]